MSDLTEVELLRIQLHLAQQAYQNCKERADADGWELAKLRNRWNKITAIIEDDNSDTIGYRLSQIAEIVRQYNGTQYTIPGQK